MRILFLILLFPTYRLNAQFISPDNWTEPRNYHTQITDFISTIKFSEVKKDTSKVTDKHFSPNGSYYFYIRSLVNGFETNNLINSGWGTFVAYIYNGKKTIKLETEYYRNFGSSLAKTYWINEKLIFFRWWLGRIAGMDMIYDVEADKIIYFEKLNDGRMYFYHYQKDKNGKSK